MCFGSTILKGNNIGPWRDGELVNGSFERDAFASMRITVIDAPDRKNIEYNEYMIF